MELDENAAAARGTAPGSDGERAYRTLFEIGVQIQADEVDLTTVLRTIVEGARDLIGSDLAWLAMLDESNEHLRIEVSTGARAPVLGRMAVRLGHGVGGVALERRETIVVEDYQPYLRAAPDAVRRAMNAESVASMICAPILRDGRMIGALYAANRQRTRFDTTEASLMSALAGQAGVAIVNSRLLAQLETNNQLLQRSEFIHRQLTEASLLDNGIGGIAGSLAELIGRSIHVEQEVVAPFAATYHPGRTQPTVGSNQAKKVRKLPIAAGGQRLGTLAVPDTDELSSIDQRALEHATTVLALELLRHRARLDVEWRLGGELLGALINAPDGVDDRLALQAARFGINLSAGHRVIVVDASDDRPGRPNQLTDSGIALVELRRSAAETAHAQSPAPPFLITSLGLHTVIALPAASGKFAEHLLSAFEELSTRHGTRLVAGVSRVGHDLSVAHREASACLRFARISAADPSVVRADDLGVMRFLFAVEDPAPLREFVRDQLGPLLDYQRDRGGEFLATARAFAESEGHHPTIAAACMIHPSTVKYRLARIGTLLDRPLKDPRVRFELRLAFSIFDFLRATLNITPGAGFVDMEQSRTSRPG